VSSHRAGAWAHLVGGQPQVREYAHDDGAVVIVAMNFIAPSQRRHLRASTPHTRCSSVAWSIRVGGRAFFVPSTPFPPSGGANTSTSPRRAVAGAATSAAAPRVPSTLAGVARGVAHARSCGAGAAGTTAPRHGELGASTPW